MINLDRVNTISNSKLLKKIVPIIKDVVTDYAPKEKSITRKIATNNSHRGTVVDLINEKLSDLADEYKQLGIVVYKKNYEKLFLIDHLNKNIYSINSLLSINDVRKKIESNIFADRLPHYIPAVSEILNSRMELNTSAEYFQLSLPETKEILYKEVPLNLDKYDLKFSTIFHNIPNIESYSFKIIEYSSNKNKIQSIALAMYDGRMKCLMNESLEDYLYTSTVFNADEYKEYIAQRGIDNNQLDIERRKETLSDTVVSLKKSN